MSFALRTPLTNAEKTGMIDGTLAAHHSSSHSGLFSLTSTFWSVENSRRKSQKVTAGLAGLAYEQIGRDPLDPQLSVVPLS
jgi:hypothetical protein